MLSIDNLMVIKDAPELKQHIRDWSQNAEMQEQARQVAHALKHADYRAKIFQNQDFPEAALLAHAQGNLSENQFATIMHIWAFSQDFARPLTIYHLSRDQLTPKTRYILSQFLTFSKGGLYELNSRISAAELKLIIDDINDQQIPDSEKVFFTGEVESEKLPDIYIGFRRLGYRLLMPISNGTHVRMIIVSQSLHQVILNRTCSHPVRLLPAIGETNMSGVLNIHGHDEHPVGLSFPDFDHDEADGLQCGRKGFIDHDGYHAALLASNPHRAVFNYAGELIKNFQAQTKSTMDSAQAMSSVVDQEHSVFLLTDRAQKQFGQDIGKQLIFELNFFFSLSKMFLLNITKKLQDSLNQQLTQLKQEDELDLTDFSKIIAEQTDKFIANLELDDAAIALFSRVIEDMLNKPDHWQNQFQFSVPIFLALVTRTDSVMTAVLELKKKQDKKDLFSQFRTGPNEEELTIKIMIKIEEICRAQVRKIFSHSKSAAGQAHQEIKSCIQAAVSQDNPDVLSKLKELPPPFVQDAILYEVGDYMPTNSSPAMGKLLQKAPRLFGYLVEQGSLPINAVISPAESDNDEDNAKGSRAVHIAAENGSSACLQSLFTAGASVNVRDQNDETPLSICCRLGDTQSVEVCLRQGASIAYLETLIVEQKVHANCLPQVKAYCEYGSQLQTLLRQAKYTEFAKLASNGPYPLSSIVVDSQSKTKRQHDSSRLLHLIAREFTCNKKSFSELADVFKADPNINICNDSQRTPLEELCYYQFGNFNHELIANMIQLGCKIRPSAEYSPLRLAIKHRDMKLLNLCLESLSPEQRKNVLNESHITLEFVKSIQKWDEETVQFFKTLLALGLDLNTQHQMSKLFSLFTEMTTTWAMIRRHELSYLFSADSGKVTVELPLELRRLCIESGANPNATTFLDNQHELVYAMEKYHETDDQAWLDYFNLLLDYGASIENSRALKRAFELDNSKLVKFIAPHCAQRDLRFGDKTLDEYSQALEHGDYLLFILSKTPKATDANELPLFARKPDESLNYRQVTLVGDYDVEAIQSQLQVCVTQVENYYHFLPADGLQLIQKSETDPTQAMSLCMEFGACQTKLQDCKKVYLERLGKLVAEHHQFSHGHDDVDEQAYARFCLKAVKAIQIIVTSLQSEVRATFPESLYQILSASIDDEVHVSKHQLPTREDLKIMTREIQDEADIGYRKLTDM